MKNILRANSVVLFQGDSITDCDRIKDAGLNSTALFSPTDLGQGYPAKIAGIWEVLFPDSGIRFINRGISGNRVGDLLERYEKDFKTLKPDMVSILIGVNDTWRRYDANDPTGVDVFENRYRNLLENLKQDLPDASIVIVEPFLISITAEQDLWWEDLNPKIQAIRSLAKEYADFFLPMNEIFIRYIAEGEKKADIAADGVHPSSLGHSIIAVEWLKALGVL